MDDAMVGAAEAVAEQRGVGIGDEVAVGEEEKLDERDLAAVVGRQRRRDRCRRAARGRASPGASPAFKFTSAMLTYFRSVVTEMTARETMPNARAPSRSFADVVPRHHIDDCACDAKGAARPRCGRGLRAASKRARSERQVGGEPTMAPNPSTIAPASSGWTASSCRGPTPSSTS